MPASGAAAISDGMAGLTRLLPPDWPPLIWLQLIERELLLFALFWFLIGMVDEWAVDAAYGWLRLHGRAHTPVLPPHAGPPAPLIGPAAVLIPAWREAEVIGATVGHLLAAWPQRGLRLYVGCYRNDPMTLAAAMAAGGADARLRLVIHAADGPTTKAHCLNRLYVAMATDEARKHTVFRSIILQDAEDMVHPRGLGLIDAGLSDAQFVQLPVRPELPARRHWVAGHYADEFAESHTKALVVRAALGAALPAAGVGCGFAREMVARIAALRRATGAATTDWAAAPFAAAPFAAAPFAAAPFAADCLTEDYELGMLIARLGGRGRFVRMRDADGALIATRSFFPADLDAAIRQKTRWIHGIALQSWDRLGWDRRWVEIWMGLRDRRGPLTALVLAAAYGLLVIEGILLIAQGLGARAHGLHSPLLSVLGGVAIFSCLWRAAARALFTAREYGWREGALAVVRIPIANLVTMLAGRRALVEYARGLLGARLVWDKTVHRDHPALVARRPVLPEAAG